MKKLFLLGLFSFFLIVGCDIVNDNTDKANDNPDKITTDDDKITTDDDKITTDDDKVTTDDDKATTDDDKATTDDDKATTDDDKATTDDDKVSDDDDKIVYDYSYVGTWTHSYTVEDEYGTEYISSKLILTKTTFEQNYSYKYILKDGYVDEDSGKSSGTIQNLGNYKLRQILVKSEIDGTMYDVSNESVYRSAYEKENGTQTDSDWAEIYQDDTSPDDLKYSVSGNKMTVGEIVYTRQ
ncbi:hypothetical protein [Spirochaeta cellobiosiphila]|uniref:hypothetical protein n=1 Tax=Spirochaeta cellobiosiphila TaxID=504483 RepID=UPI000412CE21|nr:hypothetical protein [Spirochaeta cellobiosiphila]